MSKNEVARIFHKAGKWQMVISCLVFLVAIFAALVGMQDDGMSVWTIPLIGLSMAVFVNGWLDYAIGEVIDLLQQNVDKQDELIQAVKESSAPLSVHEEKKSVIQDIESNLPRM